MITLICLLIAFFAILSFLWIFLTSGIRGIRSLYHRYQLTRSSEYKEWENSLSESEKAAYIHKGFAQIASYAFFIFLAAIILNFLYDSEILDFLASLAFVSFVVALGLSCWGYSHIKKE